MPVFIASRVDLYLQTVCSPVRTPGDIFEQEPVPSLIKNWLVGSKDSLTSIFVSINKLFV